MELRKIIKDPDASDGWVIKNIRDNHNCLIPNYVVDLCNGRTDLIPVLIKYASGIDTTLTIKDDFLIAWEC